MKQIVITLDSSEISDLEKQGDENDATEVVVVFFPPCCQFLIFLHLLMCLVILGFE